MLRASITFVFLLTFYSMLHAAPLEITMSSAEPGSTLEGAARPQTPDTRERLESWIESEMVDREWSTITEKRLRDSFDATANPNSFQIVGVTCKTSLCQVKVLFPSMTAFEDFMNDALSWLGFSMQGSVELEAKEGSEVMAYFFLLRSPMSS